MEERQQDDSEEIPPKKWKELFENSSKLKEIGMETFKKQFMEHPNKDSFINWRNDAIEDGKTMLCCVIWYERYDIAKELLDHGADVNIAEKDGWTALIIASLKGHNETVKLLIEMGASVTAATKDGNTALVCASRNGHNETVKILVEMGANVTAATKDGWTALHWAYCGGHNEIVKLLLQRPQQQQQREDEEIPPKDWLWLIENRRKVLKNKVDIETFKKQFMEHPNKEHFINWKSDDTDMGNGNTMLSLAIFYKRFDIGKILVEHGADVTIADNDGDTALTYASENGHNETVKLLLEKGADATVANKGGETALMAASLNGHTDTVKLLLEMGADATAANTDGNTALMWASKHGHNETVKLLFEMGADITAANEVGETALNFAYRNGHNEIVKLLLQQPQQQQQLEEEEIPPKNWKWLIENIANEMKNVDMETFKKHFMEHPKKERFINWKSDDYGMGNGNTMLGLAIESNRFDIGKLLVEHGADVTIADNDGDTALMYAAQNGHNETVSLLAVKGADIKVSNKKGETALMFASQNGHTEIVKLLFEMGADIKVSNKNGMTALMYASHKGHSETVKLLLEKGADITAATESGETALSLASLVGHNEIVELLLAKFAADPKVSNNNGQTLLHEACLQNNKANAEKLIQVGTDIDILDNYDHTALFYAAEKGYADIVELLMKQNANCDKTDDRSVERGYHFYDSDENDYYIVKDGRTPLFIAAEKGHQNVVAVLLQHGADPYLCNHKSMIPRDASLVHGPIQQLFQIHDFFDKREKGGAYKTEYRTCNKWNLEYKKPVPPLEDIIHDIVKYPHFADKFFGLYQENREIVNWLDEDGRTVRQVACKECREVTLFMGQYDMEVQPMYESPTCEIYKALDYGGRDGPTLQHPRPVVMKFMKNEDHYLNEIRARRKDDGSPRFSSEFVTPYLAVYRADKNPEFAKPCKTWNANGSEKNSLYGFLITMEQGGRNLMESMNAENLSAEQHKDLQRREILLNLVKIFAYLHEVGYIHGDIKPHNVVRHVDDSVTSWKAIDFDACAKIGDVVGLKLTTGSAPPEMVKVVKREGTDEKSSVKSKVILRQPGGDLDTADLVLADPSFDVWAFGMLMYQLVTGRSFFHSDLQGNVNEEGLQELANLTLLGIHKKLTSVKDANARVLLSRILRLDPKERPTMSEIGEDYYFHPSDAPQGRKADFFGKQVLSSTEEKLSLSVLETSQISKANVGDEECESMEDMERSLASSSKSDFSYFKLRDEDKDWSDKLLNSEVGKLHFDKLGGMGEKPRLIDGDTIYQSTFLRSLLSSKGPDYFMGFLVEYFELYKIMDDAHEVCQGIKANLVSNVKDLKGIFIKLFVRGKGLNDIVRGTLFCNSIDQFKYVGRQLKERYGHNVYIKPAKKEAGAWPIPKLLIYSSSRQFHGRCMSVEIQFSTVYVHLATHASNNHLVYEAIRESTGYLGDKDKDFQQFLQMLNEQYIDTEGFLRNQSAQEGRFEILMEEEVDEQENSGKTIRQESSDNKYYTVKSTGFITSGRICCGDQLFWYMSPRDHFQQFSESSFVVNKSLTLLSSHSYWSEESYDLEGKCFEFVVSFKGRGLAIAGIGTDQCLHGAAESDGGGTRCSVHVGRSKFVVRKSGIKEVYREKKLPNQERAKIRFQMQGGGALVVSFVGCEREGAEEILETVRVSMPSDPQRYYLYMRAPPGVHDIKFHDITQL